MSPTTKAASVTPLFGEDASFPVSPSAAPDPVEPAVDRAGRTLELLEQAANAKGPRAEALREEAVILNVDVAESIALRYRARGVSEEDLIQTACLGLVKAARAFDPAKSENFLAFAVPTMRGEVKRYFRDHAWTIRPPRRVQELQPQVWAASAAFIREQGRNPTNAELADLLDVTRADIDEAMNAHRCFSPASFDQPTASHGDQDGVALIDTVGEADPGFHRAEVSAVLQPLCRDLSDRDRRILHLRFVEEWTQSRIAEEFGVTQMQVSRLLSRILRQLRTALSESQLEEHAVSA